MRLTWSAGELKVGLALGDRFLFVSSCCSWSLVFCWLFVVCWFAGLLEVLDGKREGVASYIRLTQCHLHEKRRIDFKMGLFQALLLAASLGWTAVLADPSGTQHLTPITSAHS